MRRAGTRTQCAVSLERDARTTKCTAMKKRPESWRTLWLIALFLLLAALFVLPQFIELEPWTMQEAIRGKVNG